MKHLFENTLYINLDSRSDKNELTLKQFEKMGITAQRISAVDTTLLLREGSGPGGSPGMLGCGLSHLKSLKLAKENGWEYVFICEDDVDFTNPELFKSSLQKFLDDPNSPDWDVLLIGGNLREGVKLNDYSVRVRKAHCTVSYIVKKRYYDKWIKNLEESTDLLKNNLKEDGRFGLDVWWLKLQKEDTFIMIIPATVSQTKGYSDISKFVQDHSDALLNYQKGLKK